MGYLNFVNFNMVYLNLVHSNLVYSYIGYLNIVYLNVGYYGVYLNYYLLRYGPSFEINLSEMPQQFSKAGEIFIHLNKMSLSK